MSGARRWPWSRRPEPPTAPSDRLVCQQAVELITDYIEGALPAPMRARLEIHLDNCPHCHEYVAQIAKTIDALGHVGPDDLTPAARSDLVALYRSWEGEQ